MIILSLLDIDDRRGSKFCCIIGVVVNILIPLWDRLQQKENPEFLRSFAISQIATVLCCASK
jgi:hypothetical protein